ncbi:TonB-dependent receptor [Flavobacterium suaedae]|uniref:TonB-dependent receptor n=2 Tax=Flavobacterium suaedae TaxID=1767027 RepID=A0ABQ1JLD5_9FLAO|nr:TonB-dependent receptor [Flavobacterium suaedae]
MPIMAQQPQDSLFNNNQLKEITISDFHINDSLLNAPAAIGVLSVKEIQRNNNTNIAPVLNTLPGVYMQSGAINTNRITIRGIGARTQYGTNKIRAFYGNIPLTSGDSETTIEDIDMELLQQAEVIKGPLSSLYGAGLGGAILLQPKHTTVNGNTASVSTTHGSFGLMKNTVNYGYATDNGNVNISYHKLETDGYRENSEYNREGITLAGELLKKEKSSLTYFGNYTYMKAYIPSSVDKETFENNPETAAYTWKSAKGYEQYDSYLGGLSYQWQPMAGLNNATSVFVNVKDNYEPRPFNILSQNTLAYGARTQFTGQYTIAERQVNFIAGMEYFKDGYEADTYENLYEANNGNGSLQGNRLTGTEQDRNFINVFAQLRFSIIKKLELQAGINYNKTSFELKNTFPQEVISNDDYSYDGIWSPQVSLLYKPTTLQTLYVSASRGFSLPVIEETLNPEGTINPDIKPENGYNFEVGGKFYFLNKKLFTEFAVYNMQVNDLLVAQRVGEDQYVGVNAGETLHRGIEIGANYYWEVSRKCNLQPYFAASIGNYEFKEFNDNGNDYSGNELTGVPKNKINAGLRAEMDFGLYLTADYYYLDGMPLNDANSLYSGSYNLLNLKAGYQFAILKGLTSNIAFGVNNVTDTHYASMVLVNATGFNGASPRYYYPALPVNYYGNLSVNYIF